MIATGVGYAGGHTGNPSYEDVCGHGTGHAEAVMVEYDPAVISYDQLLEVFWNVHDPTVLRSSGSQYRSVIFYNSPDQKAAALASRDRLEQSGKVRQPINTEIVPASMFYRAEDYHQQYYDHAMGGSCRLN